MLKPIPFGFETPNGFFYKHKLQSSQECFLHISSSLVTSPRLAFYRVNKVEGEVFGYKKKKRSPGPTPAPLEELGGLSTRASTTAV